MSETALLSLHRKVTGHMERVQCIRNVHLEDQEADGRMTRLSSKQDACAPLNLHVYGRKEYGRPAQFAGKDISNENDSCHQRLHWDLKTRRHRLKRAVGTRI